MRSPWACSVSISWVSARCMQHPGANLEHGRRRTRQADRVPAQETVQSMPTRRHQPRSRGMRGGRGADRDRRTRVVGAGCPRPISPGRRRDRTSQSELRYSQTSEPAVGPWEGAVSPTPRRDDAERRVGALVGANIRAPRRLATRHRAGVEGGSMAGHRVPTSGNGDYCV
jgi:hypothetical protein